MAGSGEGRRTRGGKRQITLGWSTAWVLPLWILALVALAFFLRSTRELFVPIVFAALAASALAPVVSWLEARRVPRVAGSSLVVLVLMALAGWAAWSLSDDFDRAADRLPAQIREVQLRFASTADGGTVDRLRQAVSEMQELASSAQAPTPVEGGEPTPGSSSGGTEPPAGQNVGQSSVVSNYLWQGSMGLINMAGYVTVVTFLLFFLLLGAPVWRERLIRVSGDIASSRAGAEVIDEITAQIQRFLVVRVVTAVAVGLATWVVLLLLGAPAAGMWAVAAGVLNSVPFFGPLIVSVGLAVVGLFAGGLAMALKLSGSALVITTLEGWLLTPVLLGKAARMNTLAVFLGLLAWSWAWGVWGTLLAVPMLSAMKSVADHVEPLQPVSRLLEE